MALSKSGGWIILGLCAIVLYSCARAALETPEASPPAAVAPAVPAPPAPIQQSLTADALSFSCNVSASGRYTNTSLTIRNTSALPLEFSEAYIRVAGEIESIPFTPFQIPPGSVATAEALVRRKGDCAVTTVQDGKGTPVALTVKF